MPPVKYLLYFDIYNSICMTYANDIETFYNHKDKGPLISGVNITPYLVNGKNSISVAVAGLGVFDGDLLSEPAIWIKQLTNRQGISGYNYPNYQL